MLLKVLVWVTRHEDIEKMNTNYNVSKDRTRSAVVNKWRFILLVNDLNQLVNELVNIIRRFAAYVASDNINDELKNQIDEYASSEKQDVGKAISMFYNWTDNNARHDTTAININEVN